MGKTLIRLKRKKLQQELLSHQSLMIGLDKGYAGLNGFNIQNACWFYLIILLQSGQEAGSEATDQFLSGRLESHSGIPVGQ